MYLSKVCIKNFRNLEDVTVEFGEKIVLLGENGTGKSNFIEALRILLDSNYRPLLGESDFSRGSGKKPFGGRTIEIHAWFSGLDSKNEQDLLPSFHDCHGKDADTYQISAVYRPKKDKNPQNATTEDDYELLRYGGGNENNTEGAKRLRQYVRLVVIPAVRDMERDMQSWRTSPLRRLVEMISLTNNADFKSVAQSVQNASKKLEQIPDIQDLQKDIRDFLGTLVEGQSIQPTINIAGSNPEDLLRLLNIFAESDLPLERSSLGISNILYLITWLIYAERLRAMPVKGDQKPEYVLLAIEEPESHLHPHFQRLVFENVFKQEHLLLVSTHSPTIVSIADPRHFVVLKRTSNGTAACSTANFAQKDEKMRKDISRYLDATRGEMVFARGVLLVEGDAEMFLIPAFARKMKEAGKISHTLDGAGISVCNVYGTDFRPYVEFLSGLDIPFAVLTDEDPGTQNPGLKRGLELVQKINAPKHAEIEVRFNKKEWDAVKAGLEEVGIFVNQRTLEVELIQAGYGDKLCEAYQELGASDVQVEHLRAEITDNNLEAILRRIETTGMGKGRFVQRLAEKVDAGRVPPYIEKAIKYLLAKMPQPSTDLQLPPESVETPQNPEDEISF
ncbi:MAG: AAA family ATPase [Chloroflexota bacterium]|jgi:putative ATP-dependent endonuclease of OLD family